MLRKKFLKPKAFHNEPIVKFASIDEVTVLVKCERLHHLVVDMYGSTNTYTTPGDFIDPEDNWPALSMDIFRGWYPFFELGLPGALSLFLEWFMLHKVCCRNRNGYFL